MNYQRVYDELIARGVSRGKPEGYCERHHILPKVLGGADNTSNMVHLTAREHYVAHFLLAKIHGGKLWYPLLRMRHDGRCKSSHLYEIARKEYAEVARIAKTGVKRAPFSLEWRQKIGAARVGKPKSPETLRKLSLANKGKKRPAITAAKLGKPNISLSIRQTGVAKSQETRSRIAATLTGRVLSAEHKAAISAGLQGKKRGPYKSRNNAVNL